jgi:hypothetical protein
MNKPEDNGGPTVLKRFKKLFFLKGWFFIDLFDILRW